MSNCNKDVGARGGIDLVTPPFPVAGAVNAAFNFLTGGINPFSKSGGTGDFWGEPFGGLAAGGTYSAGLDAAQNAAGGWEGLGRSIYRLGGTTAKRAGVAVRIGGKAIPLIGLGFAAWQAVSDWKDCDKKCEKFK